VYKDAIDIAEAVEIIRSGGATQFDPQVVDAFMGRLDAVRALHAESVERGWDDDAQEPIGAWSAIAV
jgi:response regulator RpfG family c-di-GMP phosphodiesterase